jgi:MFS family permease
LNIGGSFLFGWLGCQIRQRKLLLIAGTFASIFSIGALIVSVQCWMLFPAKFLQGISNASVWLMCSALTLDVCPISKLGSMIGFVIGMYPIGMVFGLTVGGIY